MTTNKVITRLYDLNGIKFGTFKTKSGLLHPIYLDFRTAYIDCKLCYDIVTLIYDKVKDRQFDFICGVPTGGVHWASLLSQRMNIPLITVRDKEKEHGTKKLIEGIDLDNNSDSSHKNTVLLLEDVVTKGGSISLYKSILERYNLQVIPFTIFKWYDYIMLDTDTKMNTNKKQTLDSCITTEDMLFELIDNKRISIDTGHNILIELKPKYRRKSTRKIKQEKNSSIIVALDHSDKGKIIKQIELLGSTVCAFKFHFDLIHACDITFMKELRRLSIIHNFAIMDDSKLADVYNTNQMIVDNKLDYIDLITWHIFPGVESCPKNIDVILIGSMSTTNWLLDAKRLEYHNLPSNVIGIVSQHKWWTQDILCLTPGVSMNKKIANNGHGQTYKTLYDCPSSDILIIGSAIIKAEDPLKAATYFMTNFPIKTNKRIISSSL